MSKYPGSHVASEAWAQGLLTCQAGIQLPDEPMARWVPARPLPYFGGPLRRLKLAWAVFTGRADALFWIEQ